MRWLGLIVILGACAPVVASDSVLTAQPYIGLEERVHRKELQEFLAIDPVRTEWCAAFVNAVLEMDSIPGSDSVSNNPLMARSFLQWGHRVESTDIQSGDVVVFPRGTAGWQGHVGFYVDSQMHNDREYWVILGGNQSNEVRYDLYLPNRAIGIRRHTSPASNQKSSITWRLHN